MEIINNDSIKNILYENKKYIEVKSESRDDQDKYSKKFEKKKKILEEENRMDNENEDEKYKAQIKEIESLKCQINELKQEKNNINIQNYYYNDKIMKKLQTQMDEEEIINKQNSNFIYINDKLEEIKKYINEKISININKEFEDILNHIKNGVNEIIHLLYKYDNINKIKYDKISNIYNLKEINNNKKDNNFSFNNNRISKINYVPRKKHNINLLNEDKNNEKKEIIYSERDSKISSKIDEEPLSTTRNKINNYRNQEDIKINRFIKKGTTSYSLNKKNDYIINSNKKEYFKKKIYNTEATDRNDKPINGEKKNDNQKIFQSINSIFFYDYQQKYIKDQKINENKKEELQKEIFNDKIKGSNILKDFYMNYIETIILPLFKKNKNIIQSKLKTIKYNISVILECLGMDKNYYKNYYNQYEIKKLNFDRSNSQEAMIKFRKEFNISKEDFKDEAIEKRLIENDLDIYKTFGKMFG